MKLFEYLSDLYVNKIGRSLAGQLDVLVNWLRRWRGYGVYAEDLMIYQEVKDAVKLMFVRMLKEKGVYAKFLRMFNEHYLSKKDQWYVEHGEYNSLAQYLDKTSQEYYLSKAFPWDGVDGTTSSLGEFKMWQSIHEHWINILHSDAIISRNVTDFTVFEE